MTRLTGKRSTAAGVVLLGVLALGFTLVGCSPAKTASVPSSKATTGADVFSVTVGDCLNDSSVSGQISSVPLVQCSAPHDSEAYFSGKLADGDFPGETAVKKGAEALCGPAFTDFIGVPYQKGKGYDYTYYTPTADSWKAGDRQVMCVAFNPSGAQVTGTLRGAKG